MRRSNRLLSFIIILVIIGFVAWLFIPSASNWINNNLTTLLTVVAIVIVAFVSLRFLIEKVNTASRNTADIILIILAVGCLFWIYGVPILPVWIKQNWIPIALTIVAICVISILTWKIITRVKDQDTNWNKKERKTISTEIKRQVYAHSNNRCQWKDCEERGHLDIHHIDNNPANNYIHNLIHLCPNHHRRSHANEVPSWLLRDWAHGKYY